MYENLIFNGAFISFDGDEIKYRSSPGKEEDALKELRVFKKMVSLEKKKVSENIRQIRSDYASSVVEKGPANLGFLSLLARGTKFSGAARVLGAANRHDEKIKKEQMLAPYESQKRSIENLLLGIDQMDVGLNKIIIERG